MNYKVEAWSWCADYCKKNQWNPHDSYFWNKANLEYRRQHNIFEAGDKVVFISNERKTVILKIKEFRNFDLVHLEIIGSGLCGPSYQKEIRHATDEEIAAGKRLEVS